MNNRRYIPPVKMVGTEVVGEDVESMLKSTMRILSKEVEQLLYESHKGKLSKSSSTDLVNYVKLLNDLHAKEKDLVENLTDDELRAILDAKTKHSSGSEGTKEEE